MYLDDSRNIYMGPAHFFFAASFSWQMLLCQKHSYKLHLLQTTSMQKQYEANALHGTFNLPTNQLRWTSKRYYLRHVVSLQKPQFQPLKIILCKLLKKFQFPSFTPQFRQVCQIKFKAFRVLSPPGSQSNHPWKSRPTVALFERLV